MAPQGAPVYVPRPPRHQQVADIVVVDELDRELHARLWNVSDGGFMAECEEKLMIGAMIETTLPKLGKVRGEVRWVLGWRFGAMFLDD